MPEHDTPGPFAPNAMPATPAAKPRAPSPTPNQTRAKALASFRRLMRWMLVVALVMVLFAFASFRFMDVPITGAMVVATIAGVGVSMLVGTGLMGMIFLSANSGHDDEASDHRIDHSDFEG